MTLRSNETFKISLKLYSYLNYLIYNNQIYIYIYIYIYQFIYFLVFVINIFQLIINVYLFYCILLCPSFNYLTTYSSIYFFLLE